MCDVVGLEVSVDVGVDDGVVVGVEACVSVGELERVVVGLLVAVLDCEEVAVV